jgi:hypothetical protein
MSVSKMSVGQMSVGQMFVGYMSVGQTSVGQMSVGQMFVSQMSVGQMSVSLLSIGQIYFYQKTPTPKCELFSKVNDRRHCLPLTKAPKLKLFRGHIFSHVRPFFERAVSNLDP